MITGWKSKCNNMLSGAVVHTASAGAAADNISAGAVDYVSAANNDNNDNISSAPSDQSVYI